MDEWISLPEHNTGGEWLSMDKNQAIFGMTGKSRGLRSINFLKIASGRT
jgi:hypothetical protein